MGRLLKRIGSRDKLNKVEMTAPLLGRDSGEGAVDVDGNGAGAGDRAGAGAEDGDDNAGDRGAFDGSGGGRGRAGGGSDGSGGSQRSSLDDDVNGASVAQAQHERTVSSSGGDAAISDDAAMLARLVSLGAHNATWL